MRTPAAEGKYITTGLVLPVEKKFVRRWLPKDLELALPRLTPEGTHPVLLLLGHQYDVYPFGYPRSLPGLDYLETAAVIPFVRWADSPRHSKRFHAYMPRLYLNKLFPIVLGWLAGYAKRLARLKMKKTSYEGRRYILNSLLVTGVFAPTGNWQTPADFPNFTRLSQVFRQTIIGKFPIGYLCTDIDFKLSHARMRPVRVKLRVDNDFVGRLLPRAYEVPGIDVHPLGAFQLEVSWSLYGPVDCSS